eukprot:TRINITY_DN12703_c0_g1_i1.p1 TRINITY_DN12703_c0_g1~~TRINITY_DN12703_c0_g1_i1.p1  ORF type:complete len:352 (+),score=147.30 TRINITY_DN12703_c0_g1_i1:92-1147(+)
MALRCTHALRAARTNFQGFSAEATKRDPDYIKLMSHRINEMKDIFVGYQFPMTEFGWQKPRELMSGNPSTVEWFTRQGMTRKEQKKSFHQEWYKQALGAVQYMDGYEYPELQDPNDLMPEDTVGPLVGAIPLVASGEARAFAEAVEALRVNPNRTKRDVEGLFAEYVIWSEMKGFSEEGTGDDVLRHQPAALYEVLLVMCAEHHDWVNVTALLRELGKRNVPLRSVVAAALFEYVTSAQMGLNLFEVLKKEGVKLHLHTYYALLRALDRLEEAETAMNLNAAWHEKGEVSGEMLDFIVSGPQDGLFPETSVAGSISGSDPKEDVEKAISDLLRQDREVLYSPKGQARQAAQ